ncbi:hypothetical protein E3N88_10371 [Mikania micrantha]|uniref:FAR1 domain-containing protein n=1 Tax=Mikania micrantha TaxID=192012 RepID=A0A5N6PAF5_9ASTR|nr:hypothetical protein E3N88_10371 [Mikania micrantha]
MGGGDQPLRIPYRCLEESEEFLSPVLREPAPDPLNDEIFDILTGDSPLRYIGFEKEVYKMHETYGELSGFGIRVGGYKKWKGEITHRVLVCNKAGKPRGKVVDSVNPTLMSGACATCFKVTGCKALIRLRAIKGTSNYVLYEFSENHNHEIISSKNMDLTRKGKHLNFEDVHFIHAMSLNRAIFWADDVSKVSYQFFGDVIAFDATYSTNNYFRDIPMCCLMKSTSRCESSNSMFKVTSGSTNTLVQFLMCFDTTIDNQRLHQIKNIPDRYISNRWRKGTLPSHVYGLSQRLSVDNTEVAVHTKKQYVIEHLVGQHDEETIELLPPHGIRNKACGTNRRLVGPGEKAIENSKKTPRMCRSCNQLTFHDSRNCKKKANGGESTSQK